MPFMGSKQDSNGERISVRVEKIPWGCWYEETVHELTFPDAWSVTRPRMNDARTLSEDEILEQLDHPIGAVKLEELAVGRKSAAIVMDDISRPTPGSRILPVIIHKLESAGMDLDKITIIFALGAHRPLTRADALKKIGRELLRMVKVVNHHPFRNLVDCGISECGTPIKINSDFMCADLKIAVGSIFPHPMAGFGGGAKAIVPGIAGIETLEANHRMVTYAEDGKGVTYLGNPENPLRNDIEDIVRKTGLDFVVNLVLNSHMEMEVTV